MSDLSRKICVLGAGGWGTALACLLQSKGSPVYLWTYDPAHAQQMQALRSNPELLPGVELPESIHITSNLGEATGDASLLVLVLPSKAVRETAARLAELPIADRTPLISCTKGIEFGTGMRMSEILQETDSRLRLAVLSGPSHAEEVARGVPSAVVVGAEDAILGNELQALFSTNSFRVYTNSDVAGIELGGALKNIFAIGAGIGDGLGLGDNSKAALVTRCLAEMVRLGCVLGGRQETFFGLSGVGDLMVTCFSRHSRNRSTGERIGRGEALEAIAASSPMIAEGVPTTRSAREAAHQLGIDVPVIDRIYSMLFDGQPAEEAMQQLLDRDLKPE